MIKGNFFSCLCVGLVILSYIISVEILLFWSPVANNTTYYKEFNRVTEANGQFITFAGNSVLPPDDHFHMLR